MNELELQRRLTADPRRLSGEDQAAVEASPRLAALRERLVRVDEEMYRILTEPNVPEGLADRIVLRARYGARARWRFALAASLLAFGVAIGVALREEPEPRLEAAMIDHVVEQVGELRDDSGIEPAVLRASVAALGVDVRDPGYRIRHLANCVIDGREGRHFIIDTPHGVVSFVVLPGTDAGEAPVLLQRGRTHGYFMKRAGNTVGVFADAGSREVLEAMAQHVFAELS